MLKKPRSSRQRELSRSKPAVCRLRPRLFARPAVFPSDIFVVATFVPRASSQATAKRQVPDSDEIHVSLFYSRKMLSLLHKTFRHRRKY